MIYSADLVPGTVTLVGGGPGDPGLLTVAGFEAVRQADVGGVQQPVLGRGAVSSGGFLRDHGPSLSAAPRVCSTF